MCIRDSVDPVRNDPYLKEFQGFRGTAVEFAVLDARAGAHHLDCSAGDGMAVVQAVSVAELSFQGNGNYLHVLVGAVSYTHLETSGGTARRNARPNASGTGNYTMES